MGLNHKTRRALRRIWRKRGRWLKSNLVAFGVALVHMMLFSSPLGQRLEPYVLDAWGTLRGETAAPDEVVVISIDEESYEQLGLSSLNPWPRTLHTALLKKLAPVKPAAVVFDVTFRVADPNAAVDRDLASALQLLPTAIGRYRKATYQRGTLTHVELASHELFARSAAAVFPISLPIDYGVVRRFHLERDPSGMEYPALYPLLAAIGQSRSELPTRLDFINYYGPSGSITVVPYHQALNESAEAAERHFRGKLVFVGQLLALATGVESKDTFITSYSRVPTAGVEIHATAAANILRGDWIRRLAPEHENAVLSMLSFLITLLIISVRPGAGMLIAAALEVLWAAASYYAFLNGRFVPGVILAAVIIPGVFAVSSFCYYLRLLRAHREMESALGVKLQING